jgi:hypothetical protein
MAVYVASSKLDIEMGLGLQSGLYAGLKRVACEDYRLSRAAYDQLY